MRAHARRLAAILARSEPGARPPWLASLAGPRRRVREHARYPEDDAVDRAGGQFFLHAHDAASHGFAHFHCFVRLAGARYRLSRRRVTTHLAAIGIDVRGWPVRLLALNQWVTGEYWQSARRTLALLDRSRFRARTPAGETGRFLESLLHVHWPELRRLLADRDRQLQRALDRRPGDNVLTDRRLEVLGAVRIDLGKRLRALGALPPSATTSSASASSRRRRG